MLGKSVFVGNVICILTSLCCKDDFKFMDGGIYFHLRESTLGSNKTPLELHLNVFLGHVSL